jgi:hypothetical protein
MMLTFHLETVENMAAGVIIVASLLFILQGDLSCQFALDLVS